MSTRSVARIGAGVAAALVLSSGSAVAQAPGTPALHHVHLNSVDPQAAIDWYLDLWPAGERGEVAGHPAFIGEMAVLFNAVNRPPPGAWNPRLQRADPQSAFWHFGAFTNTTGKLADLEERGFEVLRLWTGPEDRTGIRRSGETPYSGIRNREQLRTAEPAEVRDGGFSYVVGPDGALIELTGGPRTNDAFSHIHFFHEQPQCAANWYVEALGMELPPIRNRDTGETTPRPPYEPCEVERAAPGWPSLEHAGTIRGPRGTVRYANGSVSFYSRQCVDGRCNGGRPLVPSRGQVLDHVGFSVTDLDAWVDHLHQKGVIFGDPYPFGEGRALMIYGPDGLGIELVEGPTN